MRWILLTMMLIGCGGTEQAACPPHGLTDGFTFTLVDGGFTVEAKVDRLPDGGCPPR